MVKKIFAEDLIEKKHYPILEVMNQISDDRFIKTVKNISMSIGFGENTGTCSFPEDLDEYDVANGEGFEGVEIALYTGEEVIVDYNIFYYYLEKSCISFLKESPQYKEDILSCIENYKKQYSIM